MNYYKEKNNRKDNGAGILFISNGRILLGLRGKKIDYPNTWSVPGGNILRNDQSFWHAARRETQEEVGFFPSDFLNKSVLRNTNRSGREYVTFVVEIEKSSMKELLRKFKPNDEFSELRSFKLTSLPNNIHSKTKLVLEKYRSSHE